MKFREKIKAGAKLISGIIKNRVFHKPTPFFCQWEIIYDCNMNCRFCFIPKHKEDWRPYVTTGQAYKIIDQLVRLGVVIVNITGGEPLMRKDISRIIRYTKKKGLIVFMNSNGSFLDNADKVKGLDLMRVSIDYVGKRHDEIRNRKGAFESAVKTIKILKEADIDVMITSVVTKKHEYNDLLELVRLAKRLGIQVEFSMIDTEMPSIINPKKEDRRKDDHKLMIDPNSFVEMVKEVKSRYEKTVVCPPSYIDIIKNKGLSNMGCRIMDVAVTIKSNGKMAIPCNGYPIKLLDSDLIKAWNSKEAREARKMQGKYWFCKDYKCYNRCALFPTMLLNIRSFFELLRYWKKL